MLAIFVGRIILTYGVFNDTFDEAFHVSAGLEILQRGTYTLEAQHPPLGRLLVALLPYCVAGLRLDPHNELWGTGAWAQGDLAFYWKSLALARAGNLVFAIVLFCFVYRWSSMLYGPRAGVVACLLAACCPNLLAHAGLATLDIGAAATILMSVYFFWRWSREPGLRYCLASAVAFSLAVLSKFSALLFLPPLAVLYFLFARWDRWRQRGFWQGAVAGTALRRGVAFSLVVLFLVWAAYLFEVGVIAPSGPPSLVLSVVGARRLPAQRLAEGLIQLWTHNRGGHTSYLLGHFSGQGWWYYFPVAVAVKSTLPMLLLVAIAVGFHLSKKYAGAKLDTVYPLLAVIVILGLSMASHINIGVRHVLSIYPLFAILASGLFSGEEWLAGRRRAITMTALALAAWHAGESIAAHPDYLAYFNQIARGREERFLVDSNLDWGQDLARLGEYMRANRIPLVCLSYFGRSSPAKMGVHAAPLYRQRPEQGWIAISVSNLVGAENGPAEYRWLRDRKPTVRVGKSIWLYYLGPSQGWAK